ncbi:MAG: hypothetical protein JNM76_06780 [Betaproteobacteria bacterium]|nr:hypothetical protein [Betaproteobacteria bacterium]
MLGLTSAYATSTWFTLSVAGSIAIGLVAAVNLFLQGSRSVKVTWAFGLAVAMLMVVAISATITSFGHSEKLWNHTLARVFTIVVMFWLPLALLESNADIAEAFRMGCILSAVAVIALIFNDFLRLNGMPNFLTVPHIEIDEEFSAIVRGFIFRARGGGYEPTHDAAVIAAILPLMISRLSHWWRIIWATGIVVAVYFMGYSAALVFWLIAFLICYSFLHRKTRLSTRLLSVIKMAASVALALVILDSLDILSDLNIKLESASFEQRLVSLQSIVEGSTQSATTFLFGYGPGGYIALNVDAVTNTYASFLLDLGIAGLVVYLSLIATTCYRLVALSNPLYLSAFIAYALVICGSIGNYWFPTHWLIFLYPVFAQLDHRRAAGFALSEKQNAPFGSRCDLPGLTVPKTSPMRIQQK